MAVCDENDRNCDGKDDDTRPIPPDNPGLPITINDSNQNHDGSADPTQPQLSELTGNINENNYNEWINNIEGFAIFLDFYAALMNSGYALTGDLVALVCPECEGPVVAIYQYYSILPNTVSSIAGGLWFMNGVLTGENSIRRNQTSNGTTISVSMSQDTAVALVTNYLGWTVLKEPNAATAVDVGVAFYDIDRSESSSKLLHIPYIPAFINPTISFNANSGFNFSWQGK
jgi:hypothetical protein